MKPFPFIIFIALALFVFTNNSKGATFTAIQSGNFSQSATWAGGIAPSGMIGTNKIIISSGVAVTLDVDITLNDVLSVLELKSNASLIPGTNPHFISVQLGEIIGSNCLIDIDSMYVGYFLNDYNGDIKVETFDMANSIYGALTLNVNKTLRMLPWGYCTSCTINLNQVSRTTIVFAGGIPPYASLDLTKPFNVRYEDWDYDLNNAPEITSAGLTDIDIAVGDSFNAWHYLSDLTVRGKIMFTSGLFSMWKSDLTLGSNASVGYDKGGIQFYEGGLIVNSTLNNIGHFPPSLWGAMPVDILEMNSTNPDATLYMTGHVIVNDELRLYSGKIAPLNGKIDLGWPDNGIIYGGDTNSYVITEYNSSLILNLDIQPNNTKIPIGSQEKYAPVYITTTPLKGNTHATFSVMDDVYAFPFDSTSGSIAISKPVVNMTWLVKDILGGYRIGLGWDSTMEVNGFNRNDCYISSFRGTYAYNWDVDTTSIATNNNGIYSINRDFAGAQALSVFDGRFASVKNLTHQTAAVSIYPHPANATSIISLPHEIINGMLVVYNSLGQIVKKHSINNKTQLAVGYLPCAGMYYYRVTDNEQGELWQGKLVYQ